MMATILIVEDDGIIAAHLEGLLTYAGRDQFQWRDIDLSQLVTDNLSAIRAAVREPMMLDLHLAPDLPAIQADPDYLRRALMNLVTNAVEAIGDVAGRVTLKTGVRECDDAYLRQSRLSDKPPAGRYAYLEVSDTGCGLGMSAVLGSVRRLGLRSTHDDYT